MAVHTPPENFPTHPFGEAALPLVHPEFVRPAAYKTFPTLRSALTAPVVHPVRTADTGSPPTPTTTSPTASDGCADTSTEEISPVKAISVFTSGPTRRFVPLTLFEMLRNDIVLN